MVTYDIYKPLLSQEDPNEIKVQIIKMGVLTLGSVF